jgi:mono/diheme cytochrome c family protein
MLALTTYALTTHADTAVPPDPALVDSGYRLYQQHCATCHGVAGEGADNWKKPNQLGELPPPPHGPKGHSWRHSDAMLQRMIMQGWRDPFNKTQRLTMPAFEQTLTPKEIESVIVFLNSLWTPEQRQFQLQQSRSRSALPASR